MKCSILINNYNYSKFVRECLESAVAQTYGDLEIIIVDDGSTDDSKEVISAIAEASPRPIKTIFKENGGQGSAMNEGYANCSGEIVFFLDADDFLAPDCVERVVGIWNCNMSRVYFNLQFVDEDSEHIAGVFQDSVQMPRGDLREKAAT
ncbi:MAG: glycosyltransferase family A protein [Pseudomonadota bacterium]